MRISVKNLIWIISIFISTLCAAQNGSYFISNLSPPNDNIDPRSLGISQGDHGIIYFTNKHGILEFDGSNWKVIKTPGSVYCVLALGKELYAGGSFGFGKVVSTTGNETAFELITNKPNIFSIAQLDNEIYFCNENELFHYSLLMHEFRATGLVTLLGSYYTGLHRVNKQVYISNDQGTVQRVVNSALSSAEFTMPENQPLLFSLPLKNSNETIIGTEAGKIFRISPSFGITPIVLADADHVEHQGVVNGTLVNNNLLALGTLKGGVVFIDLTTGATKEIIDYHTGLPDNEVLAIFTDTNEGVWVAHEYGFSRVAPNLPFRSFIHYPGLAGNMMCVKETNGKLLAGTSLGLYYLNTEDQYEDITITETQWIKGTAPTNSPNKKSTTATSVVAPVVVRPTPEKEKSRKKLFGFLKRNKNENPLSVENSSSTGTTTNALSNTSGNKTNTDKLISKTITRTKRILKSRQFTYKKIEGIKSKVTQLLDVNGTTLSAGIDGVFALNDLSLKPLFTEPVRYAFHSPSLNQLFISTFDDRTVSLSFNGTDWKETHVADTLRDYISYIFEDALQNIWLCGRTKIYKMEWVDGALSGISAIPIVNPLFDETVGISLGNDVFVAASGEFRKYDASKQFISYDSLPGPKKYFASAGNFWFNDGHKWRTASNKIQNLKLEWLGMFPNLRYLSPTSDGTGLWLVTANNELYRFTNPIGQEEKSKYPIFLRGVRGEQIKLLKEKNISFNQSENAVYFEFTQPNYLALKATEFRYKVEGLSKDWSDWSNVNNQIQLPFLPPGEYKIAVESRDILGNQSSIEMVSFEILPYYWKRWWFYALEFAFVVLLVLLSTWLGRKDGRYQIVSQVLSLLTVILLIQFIETGINLLIDIKSSPVFEFLIQLGITLVVFPVETQLQRFMKMFALKK